MKHFIIFFCILTCSLMIICCATTKVEDYEPKSADEEAIIEVVMLNGETTKNRDIEGHMATYHDDAKIRIYIGPENQPTVSKEYYRTWIVDQTFWGQPAKSSNFKITTKGETAQVSLALNIDNYRIPFTFKFIKENDKWLILKQTYHVEK